MYHFSRCLSGDSVATRAMQGGLVNLWVGVDLFFVLSGYLITRGLVEPTEHPRGQVLRRFYIRRVLRIFPLFYGFLIVGTLVCFVSSRPLPSWSFWVYLNNYPQGLDLQENWLTHFWSLAVEEQFYLLWPFVVVSLSRRRAIHVALGVVTLGLVVRLSVMTLSPWPVRATDYFLQHATPTHADGLLFGALLALFERDPDARAAQLFHRHRNALLVVIALAFLVPSWLAHGEDLSARIAAAISFLALGYLFALFIALVLARRLSAWTLRFLESRTLVSCGRVSYGMYVFHAPLALALEAPLLKVQDGMPAAATTAMAVVILVGGAIVSWALAALSYRFYESPFLRMKKRFG